MRAYDCSHVRGGGGTRRRITATALVQRPRRGVERLSPVGDARLARLAAGDDQVRADLLLWAYAVAIVGVLVLVAVASLGGLAVGAALAAAAAVGAAVAIVATVLASTRFVVFAAEDDGPAPRPSAAASPTSAASGAHRPVVGTGATHDARPLDVGGLERCAGALATAAGQLEPLGHDATSARTALADALAAARRRIDAAREAERTAAALDGEPSPHVVVARALAEARALAAAHRDAAADHLATAQDLLGAARSLVAARAREHLRFGSLPGDEVAPAWATTGAPLPGDGTAPDAEAARPPRHPVVADPRELTVGARARQASAQLTARAEALAALG